MRRMVGERRSASPRSTAAWRMKRPHGLTCLAEGASGTSTSVPPARGGAAVRALPCCPATAVAATGGPGTAQRDSATPQPATPNLQKEAPIVTAPRHVDLGLQWARAAFETLGEPGEFPEFVWFQRLEGGVR
jgi:hypothetical protein